MAALIIERLAKAHDRMSFRSGNVELDQYLQKQAGQDDRRRVARVFAASRDGGPTIVGFYTLSALSIDVSCLPQSAAKRLPRHPIPCVLVGRLAVGAEFHGQGIGKMLLADAIKRTLHASRDIAVYAMIVDAIDAPARAFYQHFGFLSFEQNQDRLFLPLKETSS